MREVTPFNWAFNPSKNNIVESSLSGEVIATTLEKGVTQPVLMPEGPIRPIEQTLSGGMGNTSCAVKSLNLSKMREIVAQAQEVKASSSIVASDKMEIILEKVKPTRE